ncbi:MAG: glycosyltransferase family 2 protein [Erysipelotrichaceae bacterium]|nr:glycosyltransferase family 2 protein [Erysipelotrichaceae bacterium]
MSGLVSVVVPVYNMGNSINECIASLKKQDYDNIEVILVDDGSKDNSYEQCLLAAQQDSRIKVFHTENRGSGPARNYGIEKASGKYICFPDADDYYYDNALSRMVSIMETEQCDLVVRGYTEIETETKREKINRYRNMSFSGDYVRRNYNEFLEYGSEFFINGTPWNKLYKLDVIRENRISYPPLRRHQDTGFISRYIGVINKLSFSSDVVYVNYTNDVRKEWDKFPVNYVDCVVGLYDVWKETVLTWNPENKRTEEIIKERYVERVIKAIELTFSPKAGLNGRTRKRRICEIIEMTDVRNIRGINIQSRYQTLIYKLILENRIDLLMVLVRFKVFMAKNHLM